MSSWNGSGVFLISGTGLPYVGATVISSTVANQLNADLATGLTNTICKDGQSTTTAQIPFALGAYVVTGGLQFPATQSSSANVNVLDDYEEGTWTPTFTSLTAVGAQTHTGNYVKIGRIVFYQIKASAATSVASTTATFCDNFPFAISFGFFPNTCCSEDQTKTAIGLGGVNTNTVYLGAIAATSAIQISGFAMTPT